MNYQRNCSGCGRLIIFPEHALTCPCIACGLLNDRIKLQGQALEAFQHASELRELGDFDNAAKSYRRVLDEFPEDHGAYWELALCTYHVRYDEDGRTGKCRPVPGCLQNSPLQEDADYKQAIRLAPEEIGAQYAADAQVIDRILSAVRHLMEEQEPYDLFICRSGDCGGELYPLLYAEGWRVYEAENLPSADAEEEARAFYALHTARLLLAAGGNALEAPQAKRHWQRYLTMMGKDSGKHLLPLAYARESADGLPQPLQRWQTETLTMDESREAASALLEKVRRYAGEPAYPGCGEELFTSVAAGEGCVVTGYTGTAQKVRIPDRIGQRRVVGIGGGAFFAQSRLTEILLPQTVTDIAPEAFSGCSGLRALHLPGGLRTIGDRALLGCSGLKELRLPEGLQFIGSKALLGCAFLTELPLPAGLRTIGDHAFMGCTGLRRIVLPRGLRQVSDGLLMCCTALTEAALPDGLESIGSDAFRTCTALRSLTIPESTGRIGPKAFADCRTLTVRGAAGSAAQLAAEEDGASFGTAR